MLIKILSSVKSTLNLVLIRERAARPNFEWILTVFLTCYSLLFSLLLWTSADAIHDCFEVVVIASTSGVTELLTRPRLRIHVPSLNALEAVARLLWQLAPVVDKAVNELILLLHQFLQLWNFLLVFDGYFRNAPQPAENQGEEPQSDDQGEDGQNHGALAAVLAVLEADNTSADTFDCRDHFRASALLCFWHILHLGAVHNIRTLSTCVQQLSSAHLCVPHRERP